MDDLIQRRFPVMFRKGEDGPVTMPWAVAERAVAAFQAQPGCGGQSMERLAQRGGLWAGELDECYPNWREETATHDA